MKATTMKFYKILLAEFVFICFFAGSSWAGMNPLFPKEPAKIQDIKNSGAPAEKNEPQTLSGESGTPKEEVKPQDETKPREDSKDEAQSNPEEKKADETAAAAQSPAPETATAAESESEEDDTFNETPKDPSVQAGALTFNFDNAELAEVIRTLADLLQINYLIDPKIGGKITIHTSGKLDRKDLFPIFYQILEVNGLTAIRNDNFYKIVPAKDAPKNAISSRSGREYKSSMPGEEIIIQIITLNSISADEISKILAPFVSADGVIVAHAESNTILVIDKSYNISKILRLVNAFDSDVFERVNYRFYSLQYGDVATLAEVMDKMLVAYGSSVKTNVAFVPIERLNALLVVSSNPKLFDEIGEFIKNYDVPSQSSEPSIFVYAVKNGQAEEIADLLNSIFKGKKSKKEEKKSTSKKTSKERNPLGKSTIEERYKEKEKEIIPPPQPTQPATSETEAAVGTNSLRGEINITADETRNSLIIQASPTDYQIVKNLLTQLDIMPRQVLIEVSIAEISLDDETNMGVEWSYKKGDGSLSTSLLNATAGKSGLTFTIGDTTQWNAIISAAASKNRANILSSPSVLASNGLPASIDISTEIPVATSSYQYTTDENPILSSDIEYRDTGVMLTVTPHINELGLVTMEIDQEVSEKAENIDVGGESYPSFFKRTAQTTLTVQSGQTIVIGGLIKETKSEGAVGIPWFVSVPVLNFLFGKTSDTIEKNELIIMISPYVIAQMDDVDAVTKEFKGKLNTLFPELKETPVTILEKEKQEKE